MALKLDMTLDNGINLPEAYLKISKIVFTYEDVNTAEIILSVYKDQESFNSGKSEVLHLTYRCSGAVFNTYFSEAVLNIENRNVLNGAYEWLLAMEQFFDAVEV